MPADQSVASKPNPPELYNSRIVQSWLEYLAEVHPHVDHVKLFDAAGIDTRQADDPKQWFSQRQIDRFHAYIDKQIRDPDIARQAGRFVVYKKRPNVLQQYAFGFFSPMAAYLGLSKIMPRVTRGSDYHVRKLAASRVVITNSPANGAEEKLFQCENRIGIYEAIGRLFTKNYATVEHQLERAQKMEALGTLAGGVAHDLNNILTGIVSYPDLLLAELPVESTMRRPIETILKSGQRAAAIVQDLLTLARRGVMVTKPLYLNVIVDDYLGSPEFGELGAFHPHCEVKLSLAVDLPVIEGSPVHLSKTIMNLVGNAMEAMPYGGTVQIVTEHRIVTTAIDAYERVAPGDYVTLQVKDVGTGIAARDLHHIFEPFYTKKIMGRSGTGLGMAVVWGTVKDSSGYIDVDTQIGRGTTFTLYFPVSESPVEETADEKTNERYVGNGETILVVDDVAEQREVAAAILSGLGYRVNVVASGEAAEAYVQNNKVDLVVLDMIMLPGIDGLETYRRILKHHPEQKAIVATGYSETHRVAEVRRLGAATCIRKPYTIETIGVAAHQALNSDHRHGADHVT